MKYTTRHGKRVTYYGVTAIVYWHREMVLIGRLTVEGAESLARSGHPVPVHDGMYAAIGRVEA